MGPPRYRVAFLFLKMFKNLQTRLFQSNFHTRVSCPEEPAEGSELQSMISPQAPQPNGTVST
jgi:hypothetical protein